MTYFLRILIPVLLWSALSAAPGAGSESAQPHCLACHRPHYVELGACTLCHRGDERTERLSVAHRKLIPGSIAGFALSGDRKTAYGLHLLKRLGCRRCHLWGGEGNRLATGLDGGYFASRVDEIVTALRHPAEQMPDFALDAGQVEAVVGALLRVSLEMGPPGAEQPLMVHFSSGGRKRKNVFENRCGPCHRALTHRFGALGSGDAAPNLSGLLSRHHPGGVDGEPWTAERLRKWLANPRQLRANALMQPLRMEEAEVEVILEVFEGDSGGEIR